MFSPRPMHQQPYLCIQMIITNINLFRAHHRYRTRKKPIPNERQEQWFKLHLMTIYRWWWWFVIRTIYLWLEDKKVVTELPDKDRIANVNQQKIQTKGFLFSWEIQNKLSQLPAYDAFYSNFHSSSYQVFYQQTWETYP